MVFQERMWSVKLMIFFQQIDVSRNNRTGAVSATL